MVLAVSRINLGQVGERQSHLVQAAVLYEPGLAINRDLRNDRDAAFALSRLGRVATARGEIASAAAFYREELALRREFPDPHGLSGCLEGIACLAALSDQPVISTRLFGAAKARREQRGAPRSPSEEMRSQRGANAVVSAIGGPSFTSAKSAGRLLSFDQSVVEAMNALEAVRDCYGIESPASILSAPRQVLSRLSRW